MPNRLTVRSPDARKLTADLESVRLGLGATVAAVQREAADIIAGRTRKLTPVGPGPRPNARNANDRLPHIRDTIAGRAAGVISTHPAAPLFEQGGSITPRGRGTKPIVIPRVAMARKAGLREQGRVERLLADRFARLMADAGL